MIADLTVGLRLFFGREHTLLSYMNYYNATRTHLSLGKDASIPYAV